MVQGRVSGKPNTGFWQRAPEKKKTKSISIIRQNAMMIVTPGIVGHTKPLYSCFRKQTLLKVHYVLAEDVLKLGSLLPTTYSKYSNRCTHLSHAATKRPQTAQVGLNQCVAQLDTGRDSHTRDHPPVSFPCLAPVDYRSKRIPVPRMNTEHQSLLPRRFEHNNPLTGTSFVRDNLVKNAGSL